jgi:hypothetical protein
MAVFIRLCVVTLLFCYDAVHNFNYNLIHTYIFKYVLSTVHIRAPTTTCKGKNQRLRLEGARYVNRRLIF